MNWTVPAARGVVVAVRLSPVPGAAGEGGVTPNVVVVAVGVAWNAYPAPWRLTVTVARPAPAPTGGPAIPAEPPGPAPVRPSAANILVASFCGDAAAPVQPPEGRTNT